MVLILIVGFMFTTRLFWGVFPLFFSDFYLETWYTGLTSIMEIAWCVIPLSLAFLIKDKSRQMVILILGGLYYLYGLFGIIDRIFRITDLF